MVVCGGWGKKTHTRGDDLLVGPPSYRTIHSVLVLKPGKPPPKGATKSYKKPEKSGKVPKSQKRCYKKLQKAGKVGGKG